MIENNQNNPSIPSASAQNGVNFVTRKNDTLLDWTTMQPPMLLAFDGNNSPNNMWHTVTKPDAYPPK